jgi:hypothetical protein
MIALHPLLPASQPQEVSAHLSLVWHDYTPASSNYKKEEYEEEMG